MKFFLAVLFIVQRRFRIYKKNRRHIMKGSKRFSVEKSSLRFFSFLDVNSI